MENGPLEIVDFPMKNGGSFHSKMLVHQRVFGQTLASYRKVFGTNKQIEQPTDYFPCSMIKTISSYPTWIGNLVARGK